jgi:hypothetical protein
METTNLNSNQYNNCLFHYTKAENAIGIFKSKTFKFSDLHNTNDPFEKLQNRVDFNADTKQEYVTYWEGLCDFFNLEVSIACFGEYDGKVSPSEKWTMWAHYGEKHQGVCLVFDKTKLLFEVEKQTKDYLPNKINYNLKTLYLTYNEEILKIPYKKFLNDFGSYLLFSKHIDWSCENEFRIVVIKKQFEIDISNCLKSVLFGPEMDPKIEKECIDHLNKFPIKVKNGKLLYCGSGYLRPFDLFPE